jgi:hypothetical protein
MCRSLVFILDHVMHVLSLLRTEPPQVMEQCEWCHRCDWFFHLHRADTKRWFCHSCWAPLESLLSLNSAPPKQLIAYQISSWQSEPKPLFLTPREYWLMLLHQRASL